MPTGYQNVIKQREKDKVVQAKTKENKSNKKIKKDLAKAKEDLVALTARVVILEGG